ncbi:MAG: zf-HC2 domain-containing protein [Actinobacteria bacterium]|nr:zf-HC2 domain-containing protein [Actinomycetota bacterium]
MSDRRAVWHPDELLAAFVEGDLAEGDRALVERHVALCSTCREEVEFARAGRLALTGLPQLKPPGVVPAVLALASGRGEASGTGSREKAAAVSAPVATFPAARRRRGRDAKVWQRAGWAAGLAAAACLAAVLLVSGPDVLTRGGDGAADTAGRAVGPEGGAVSEGDESPLDDAPDRTRQSLSSLAGRLASEPGRSPTQPTGPGATDNSFGTAQELAGGERECLGRAAEAPAGARLSYLEIGSFEGTPAFIAGYLSDRGTAPLFRLVAVSRVGCRLLYGIDVPV